MSSSNGVSSDCPRLRVVMYSALPFERVAWKQALEETSVGSHFDIRYVTARLDCTTAPLSEGAKIVVLFASDYSHDPAVLRALKLNGVELALFRYAGKASIETKVAKEVGLRIAQVSSTRARKAVAEYVITLILALQRNILLFAARTKNGSFNARYASTQRVLVERTVGIMGTDKVGCQVIKILRRIGCRIVAFDVLESPEAKKENVEYVELVELLKMSDVISMHIPLEEHTRHIMNKAVFNQCKHGVHIINTGNLDLVDLNALVDAMDSGKVGGFAADIYDGSTSHLFRDSSHEEETSNIPLAQLKSRRNVMLTAHQSVSTPLGQIEIARSAVQILKEFYQVQSTTSNESSTNSR